MGFLSVFILDGFFFYLSRPTAFCRAPDRPRLPLVVSCRDRMPAEGKEIASATKRTYPIMSLDFVFRRAPLPKFGAARFEFAGERVGRRRTGALGRRSKPQRDREVSGRKQQRRGRRQWVHSPWDCRCTKMKMRLCRSCSGPGDAWWGLCGVGALL